MPHPNRAQAFDYSDPHAEMVLIRQTCDAEDAGREVCAPYNAPTAERLEQVRMQLAAALDLQLSRGRHTRMDVVISLRTKLAEVGNRLASIATPDAVA